MQQGLGAISQAPCESDALRQEQYPFWPWTFWLCCNPSGPVLGGAMPLNQPKYAYRPKARRQESLGGARWKACVRSLAKLRGTWKLWFMIHDKFLQPTAARRSLHVRGWRLDVHMPRKRPRFRTSQLSKKIAKHSCNPNHWNRSFERRLKIYLDTVFKDPWNRSVSGLFSGIRPRS